MRNLRDILKERPCKGAAVSIGALIGELGGGSFTETF
jgi:hypothetical protein